MDLKQFKQFRRDLLGWPHKEVEDTERLELLNTAFDYIDPIDVCHASLQAVVETYDIESKIYKRHTFNDGSVIIEESCKWSDIGL